MRKVLKTFEILSQLSELVGKPNHPVHLIQFAGTAVWVFGTVCVGSQSFGVGFVLRFFFWIPDSLRKVLKNFESLSQPSELVRKLNHPVHLIKFVGTTVWVFGTVCVGSQSFRVRFVLRLFFWISDSLRKVLKIFESLSQPYGLVGKPNQSVH